MRGYAILHHWHICHCLLFWNSVILIGVWWHLPVLTCNYQMKNDTECHLLICIHISLLVKCLLQSSTHFLELFRYYCKSFYIFWIQVFHQICSLQVSLPTLGLSFYYINSRFHIAHGFNFKKVAAMSKKLSAKSKVTQVSPIFSSNFMAICFIFTFNPFYF